MKQMLHEWAVADRVTLAIAFTDILGSTSLGNRLGSEELTVVKDAHFRQARRLIENNRGYEIKTIGDAFMVAFHTALDALNFSLSLHDFTGHEFISIRAGVHVGAVQITEGDLLGSPVNYASRLVGWRKDDWVVVSDRAKDDVEDEIGNDRGIFTFTKHVDTLKDFPEDQTIWRAEYREVFSARQITTESLSSYLESKFAGREHANAGAVAELAIQLRESGYMTLGDIERAREKGWDAFLAYEPRRFVGNDLIIRASNKDTRLSDVGAIRSLLHIVDEDFRASSGEHFSTSQMDRLNEARRLVRK